MKNNPIRYVTVAGDYFNDYSVMVQRKNSQQFYTHVRWDLLDKIADAAKALKWAELDASYGLGTDTRANVYVKTEEPHAPQVKQAMEIKSVEIWIHDAHDSNEAAKGLKAQGVEFSLDEYRNRFTIQLPLAEAPARDK
jgi:hypothetical protein